MPLHKSHSIPLDSPIDRGWEQVAGLRQCPPLWKYRCLGGLVLNYAIYSNYQSTQWFVAASSGPAAPRLKEIVSGFHTLKNQDSPKSSPIGKLLEDRLSDFHHFATPTLPHLLALLTHESNSFPPKGTGLIVVDSVSSLFAAAFSRANDDSDNKQTPDKPKRNDAGAWAASRKWAVMGEFVSKLGKLAARNNIAVLLTSETTTRIRIETGAMLHPAISGTAWESGVSARIVLFRDWPFEAAKALNEGYVPGMRFAGISKAGGVSYERLDKIVSFIIDKVCTDYANALVSRLIWVAWAA